MRVQRELWGNVVPQMNASPVKKPAAAAAAMGKAKTAKGKGKGKLEEVVVIDDAEAEGAGSVEKGETVVYWMRMEDLRVIDNHALSLANNYACAHGVPLVVLWVATTGDWKAHDRGTRAVDFRLRNLRGLKVSSAKGFKVVLGEPEVTEERKGKGKRRGERVVREVLLFHLLTVRSG